MIQKHHRGWRSLLRTILMISVVISPFLSCRWVSDGEKPTEPTPTPTAPVGQVSPTPQEPDSQVARRGANVGLGSDGGDLQTLNDDEWHALQTGDRVNTDENGEAELDIAKCMRIFLFMRGALTKAPCPKSASISGNALCAQSGTAAFNNSCGSQVVIETGSAEIRLRGTYLSVTYLPDRQLTLVTVLKGKVDVRRVTNVEQRAMGDWVEVNEGQMWMSVPDDKRAEWSDEDTGVVVAEAVSVEQMDELSGRLPELRPWLVKLAERAKEANVPFRISIPPAGDVSQINCDCGNLEFGILTRQYRAECLAAENALKEQFQRTGRIEGTCNPVAQGPNASPKG